MKERLGEGGFGTVFRAREVGGSRDVCLKVTRDAASWHRECYFGELFRGNDRVIQVEDSFPYDAGRRVEYVLVLELAERGDLTTYLRSSTQPWIESQIRREVAGILKPLDQLHVSGGLHRDLTPFNVFVSGDLSLKLGDFGIARHARPEVGVPARTLNFGFAPPSTLRESAWWRAPDDVWQVGQLLAFLVMGDSDCPIEPRQVRDLACSGSLKAVIRRAIGPRTDRYRNAYELAAAVKGSATERDVPRARLRSLEGRTVVFTGRLWTRRSDAARLVSRCGGCVAAKVSSKTDVIVRGEPSPGYVAGTRGMKLLRAEVLKERGARIAILSEAQFRRLVEGAP